MKVLEVQSYTSSLHLSHYWPHYRLPQGWPARLTGALGPLNRCGGQKSCCVSFDCKGKEDNYPPATVHMESREVVFMAQFCYTWQIDLNAKINSSYSKRENDI